MSDSLLVAVIGGASLILSTVTASLLGFVFSRLGKIRKDTKATTEQIVNDHGTKNFRDENDSRHAETLRIFKSINEKLAKVEDTTGALLIGWFENRERIEDIEDTIGGNKMSENNEGETSLVPVPKVAAAGIAGAVTVVIVFAVQLIWPDLVIPEPVSAAATAIIAFLAGYIKKN